MSDQSQQSSTDPKILSVEELTHGLHLAFKKIAELETALADKQNFTASHFDALLAEIDARLKPHVENLQAELSKVSVHIATLGHVIENGIGPDPRHGPATFGPQHEMPPSTKDAPEQVTAEPDPPKHDYFGAAKKFAPADQTVQPLHPIQATAE